MEEANCRLCSEGLYRDPGVSVLIEEVQAWIALLHGQACSMGLVVVEDDAEELFVSGDEYLFLAASAVEDDGRFIAGLKGNWNSAVVGSVEVNRRVGTVLHLEPASRSASFILEDELVCFDDAL